MSLAVLADHMASKGRGPDSMLIHMSPREVQGLQALAVKNGGSLTINPDTGLPEAGFLDKLLPTIIGAGISFFSGGAINPMQAAMIVGGVQTARTGDIGKGLAAGLGAYGGAGLTAGMTTAGAEALGGEAAGQSYAASAPGALEGAGAGLSADMMANLENAGISNAGAASAAQQAAAERVASASPFEKLSAGAAKASADPMSFAKLNAKNLMYAAGPAIMAGANVGAKGPQTVTKPGMIRPFAFDPYGGTYTAGTPYEAAPTKAAEGGLMGMAQGGGMFDFVQRSEPVVRMAEGGIAGYADGGVPTTDPAIAQILADAARLRTATASTAPAQAVAVPGIVDVTKPGQYVTDPATGNAVALSAYSPGFDPSNKIAQTYLGELAAKGGQDTTSQMFNQMGASQAQQDTNAAAWATEKARLDAIDAANAAKQPTGLAALANIPADASYTNRWFAERGLGFSPIDKSIDNFFAEYADDLASLTPQQQEATMRAALATEKMNEADVVKATGKNISQWIQQKNASVIPGGFYGNNTGNALTTTPGGITTNFDNTVTVAPNIPGRPEGGFTGIGQLKDAYTAGGGSLGYVPYAPKTIEEFESKYNKLTGGSKAAYDYLMGKTPYDPVPSTPTGEIQKPYWESVGRYPVNLATKKYIYQNGKYVLNPDYVKPPYVLAGEKAAAAKETAKADAASGKSINVINNQGDTEAAYMRDDGFYYTSGGNKFDEKGVQVAADGGLMAMARGGSTQFDLGGYSDGGRLLRGPGDGVSDSIPATIGNKRPARLADGEFVVPARIVSELGNGSTEAGARKLYAMMDRVQAARRGTVGKNKVAKNSRADKHLPA